MSELFSPCPHCKTDISLSKIDFVSLLSFSKRHECSACNKRSKVNKKSKLLSLAAFYLVFVILLYSFSFVIGTANVALMFNILLAGVVGAYVSAIVGQQFPVLTAVSDNPRAKF